VNPIQEYLNDLRRSAGVKGCVLIMDDGLIVAETLDARFRDDVVAGLTSYVAMVTNKALNEAGFDHFDQFVLHATHGKAVFLTIDKSFLVVLLDQFADLEQSRAEIQGTVQRLRRTARLGRT
jgi:predicted regulator of Ras-like GTPase activity (Roadblock/LC7/MglB family)